VRKLSLAFPVVVLALTISTSSLVYGQITGFGGATNTGWTPNANSFSSAAGVPNVSGTGTLADVLSLTTLSTNEASSYWFNTPQNITNFTESFTFTAVHTSPPSQFDSGGIAAVWQNVGTTALGGSGDNLGFANLASSAGLAMNIGGLIYAPGGSGYNNTIAAGSPATTTTLGAGVYIDSGNPINVSLSYKESDGALTETMTDTVTVERSPEFGAASAFKAKLAQRRLSSA
jgi:hypothetical protein